MRRVVQGSEIDMFEGQTGGMDEATTPPSESNVNNVVKAEIMTLKVKDQANNIMTFKVKRTSEMRKIFEAYAQRLGLPPGQLRFMYEGSRVNAVDTPGVLEMEEDDQMDVFLDQQGGSDEPPAKTKAEDAAITINVQDTSGGSIAFKVKKTTRMEKIIEAYASRKGVAAHAVRLILPETGGRVNKDDTPKMLEMDDDSVLQAMIEQQGGEDHWGHS